MLLLDEEKGQRTHPRRIPERGQDWRSMLGKIVAKQPPVTINEFDPGVIPVEPITFAEIKARIRTLKQETTRRKIAGATAAGLLALSLPTYGMLKNDPNAYETKSDNPLTPLIAQANPAQGMESAVAGRTHIITSEGRQASRVAENLVDQAFAVSEGRNGQGAIIDSEAATADNPIAQRHIYTTDNRVDVILRGPVSPGHQLDPSHTTVIVAKEMENGTVTDSYDAKGSPGTASWKSQASSTQAAEHIDRALRVLG